MGCVDQSTVTASSREAAQRTIGWQRRADGPLSAVAGSLLARRQRAARRGQECDGRMSVGCCGGWGRYARRELVGAGVCSWGGRLAAAAEQMRRGCWYYRVRMVQEDGSIL
jgi:hypothetical protein